RGFHDPIDDRVRAAYDWARHFIGCAFLDQLEEQDVLRAWETKSLRDTFRWVCVILNGLTGKSRSELHELESPARNRSTSASSNATTTALAPIAADVVTPPDSGGANSATRAPFENLLRHRRALNRANLTWSLLAAHVSLHLSARRRHAHNLELPSSF